MRSRIFRLDEPVAYLNESHFGSCTAKYYEPVLEAFSIEYATLKVHDFIEESPRKELLLGAEFEIRGSYIIRPDYIGKWPSSDISPVLIIHYHGIRDYSKLFPSVNDDNLKIRMGELYEEAEKNFDNHAWLSFLVMCGGIFEGLLFYFTGKKNTKFKELINYAYLDGYITERECCLIDEVRDLRNLVHPERRNEPYITRTDAMDIRKVLDDIIVRFSKS